MSCPNCRAEGASRFCPCCGQDNRRGRLDARSVLADAVQNLVGWDTALVRTLRGMARAPGTTAAEFVDGRRRRYVNPARFALISLALWFLLTKLFGLDVMDVSGIRITNSSGNVQGLVDEIRGFLARNLQLLLYLALPLRAFILRFMFKGSGRNLAECLVLVLFVAGFTYLLRTVTTPLFAFGCDWIAKVNMLIALVWSILGAHGFFGRSWFQTIWRVLCVTFLHTVGTLIFFACVAVPWALWLNG